MHKCVGWRAHSRSEPPTTWQAPRHRIKTCGFLVLFCHLLAFLSFPPCLLSLSVASLLIGAVDVSVSFCDSLALQEHTTAGLHNGQTLQRLAWRERKRWQRQRRRKMIIMILKCKIKFSILLCEKSIGRNYRSNGYASAVVWCKAMARSECIIGRMDSMMPGGRAIAAARRRGIWRRWIIILTFFFFASPFDSKTTTNRTDIESDCNYVSRQRKTSPVGRPFVQCLANCACLTNSIKICLASFFSCFFSLFFFFCCFAFFHFILLFDRSGGRSFRQSFACWLVCLPLMIRFVFASFCTFRFFSVFAFKLRGVFVAHLKKYYL